MLSGNILDVYPDYEKNTMVTWLLQNGKPLRIEDSYEPSFCVHTPSKDISEIARTLEVLPQVKRLQLTPAKLTLGSPRHTMVLEVVPKTLNSLHTLANLIDAWGGFHSSLGWSMKTVPAGILRAGRRPFQIRRRLGRSP